MPQLKILVCIWVKLASTFNSAQGDWSRSGHIVYIFYASMGGSKSAAATF